MTDAHEPEPREWQSAQHPGFDNYPPAPSTPHRPTRRTPLPPLHPPQQSDEQPVEGRNTRPGPQKVPRKLTVTRVAAMRGRELTERGFASFQRAAKADGAERSGLTALIYTVIVGFAADATLSVALANTLFFSAAKGESQTKVALYLAITLAPFAVIAPLIGPLLDRLQHGRRIAMATCFALRGVVAVLLIFYFNTWLLYPAALAAMVLSKSFAVLKSAVTPRVLPPGIDLVRTNSRLTVFGLLGGTIVAGGVAGAIALLGGSAGALWFLVLICAAGTVLCMRIPSWVEVTEGEVPATLTYHSDAAPTGRRRGRQRQPFGRAVITGLWGNSAIRVLTGFLTLYVAFVAKSHTEHQAWQQAAMLGCVGAAAGIGNFIGNAAGARIPLGRPGLIVLQCTIACTAVCTFAAVADGLFAVAIVGLVGSGASALAKVSLDASIQDDLPPESIASGFGRSETALQLSWVIGGAMGVLLPTQWWIGFTVVSVVLGFGLVQTVLSYTGHTLLPGFGGNRPVHAHPEPTGSPAS